jgi:hypothetical protein
VIEDREKGWPQEKKEKPQKIEDIHAQFEQEQEMIRKRTQGKSHSDSRR